MPRVCQGRIEEYKSCPSLLDKTYDQLEELFLIKFIVAFKRWYELLLAENLDLGYASFFDRPKSSDLLNFLLLNRKIIYLF